MTFARTSLFAGESTTGTILLSHPAPASGVVVTLASNDPGAVVSPQVATLAPDQDRMTFTVTTSASFAQDRMVAITGSMNDVSTRRTLQVWLMPRAQTFFAFINEPGDYLGQGTIVRLVSPETAFRSSNTRATAVAISDTPRFDWTVGFYAPLDSQLTARRYDNVTSSVDPTHAAMLITGQVRSCTMTGWFEVREISLTASGDLARFDATFEQRCSDSPSTLRGEIKFVR